MEQYKKALSRKIGLVMMSSGILLLLIVYLLFFFPGEPVVGKFPHFFLIGFAFGINAVGFYYTYRYQRALKDETLLRKYYYEDQDERLNLIRMKAGFPSLSVAGAIFLVASAVAAYFDATVTYTLLAGAIFLFLYQVVLLFVLSAKY